MRPVASISSSRLVTLGLVTVSIAATSTLLADVFQGRIRSSRRPGASVDQSAAVTG